MIRFPLNVFGASTPGSARGARLNARTHGQFERAARTIARRPGDTAEMVARVAEHLQLDADDLAFLVDVRQSLLRAATSGRRAAA